MGLLLQCFIPAGFRSPIFVTFIAWNLSFVKDKVKGRDLPQRTQPARAGNWSYGAVTALFRRAMHRRLERPGRAQRNVRWGSGDGGRKGFSRPGRGRRAGPGGGRRDNNACPASPCEAHGQKQAWGLPAACPRAAARAACVLRQKAPVPWGLRSPGVCARQTEPHSDTSDCLTTEGDMPR